jgi:hypothetical protein
LPNSGFCEITYCFIKVFEQLKCRFDALIHKFGIGAVVDINIAIEHWMKGAAD